MNPPGGNNVSPHYRTGVTAMPPRGLPRGYRAKTTADYPPMNAHEYECARTWLGLNGINFAQLIGVGWRNGQRYQAGGTIPEPVARLIRTIINNQLTPDQVG